jgi:hypothetical protein
MDTDSSVKQVRAGSTRVMITRTTTMTMIVRNFFTARRLVVAFTLAISAVTASGLPTSAVELLGVTSSSNYSSGKNFASAPQLSLPPETPFYRSPAFRQDFASFGLARGVDEFSDDTFSDNDVLSDNQGRHRYSVFSAVALSALLPGAGHWYLGNKRGARFFLGAEAGIWTAFAALKVNAGWKQDDVERFATRHAGVNGLNRDEQFYRQLTFYSSREEYNSLGRAFDSDLPFIADTPDNDWNWDSQESRAEFRQLFNNQNSADRNADFMFIAAIVNRLTSAVLAWRATQKLNNQLDEDDSEFGKRVPRDSGYGSVRRTTFRLVKPAPGRNASDGLMLSVSHLF